MFCQETLLSSPYYLNHSYKICQNIIFKTFIFWWCLLFLLFSTSFLLRFLFSLSSFFCLVFLIIFLVVSCICISYFFVFHFSGMFCNFLFWLYHISCSIKITVFSQIIYIFFFTTSIFYFIEN